MSAGMKFPEFAGKVALVTGGASGIGAACARGFAAQGAKVVIADFNEAAATAQAAEIATQGGEAFAVTCNVADTASATGMVAATLARFGALHYAINSAGVSDEAKPVADATDSGWERVIGVNLNGVFYSMRAEIPAMLQGGGGAIVNIASVMGLVSVGFAPAYVAAKHGVVGLTRSAAQAYAQQGIRINALCPGFIDTPMLANSSLDAAAIKGLEALHPIGRLGRAEEIAAWALFLCSDAASFAVGGALPVDGGYTTL